MKAQYTLIGLCTLLLSAPAWGQSTDVAAEAFAKGQTLLQAGHFEQALEAFAAAAQQDRSNVEYRQQYGVLRRVIKVRESLATETDIEKWQSYAHALRAYYYGHDLYQPALTLDREAHEKLNTPETAAMLGESLINVGNDAEAITVLQQIEPAKATMQSRVLTGIAFAHEGKMAEAEGIAKDVGTPADVGPGMLFDVARLQALTGEDATAVKLLAQCFESTPPSRLEAFKSYAKDHADFAALAEGEAFAQALKTESKVKESGCSGGTNCGKCPNRSKGCGDKKEGDEKAPCDQKD